MRLLAMLFLPVPESLQWLGQWRALRLRPTGTPPRISVRQTDALTHTVDALADERCSGTVVDLETQAVYVVAEEGTTCTSVLWPDAEFSTLDKVEALHALHAWQLDTFGRPLRGALDESTVDAAVWTLSGGVE